MMLVLRRTNTIQIQNKYNTKLVQIQYKYIRNTIQIQKKCSRNTKQRMRRRGHKMLVLGGRCGNRNQTKSGGRYCLLQSIACYIYKYIRNTIQIHQKYNTNTKEKQQKYNTNTNKERGQELLTTSSQPSLYRHRFMYVYIVCFHNILQVSVYKYCVVYILSCIEHDWERENWQYCL